MKGDINDSKAPVFYGHNKNDIRKYAEELRFYSNSLGWLHHFGEYDLNSESELPGPLREAFATLWHRTDGCDCLLAQYHDEYGIALIATYDGFIHEKDAATMLNRFYGVAKHNAAILSKDPAFRNARLIASASNGYFEMPEIAAFFPCTSTREEIDAAAARLHEVAYDHSKMPKACLAATA